MDTSPQPAGYRLTASRRPFITDVSMMCRCVLTTRKTRLRSAVGSIFCVCRSPCLTFFLRPLALLAQTRLGWTENCERKLSWNGFECVRLIVSSRIHLWYAKLLLTLYAGMSKGRKHPKSVKKQIYEGTLVTWWMDCETTKDPRSAVASNQ